MKTVLTIILVLISFILSAQIKTNAVKNGNDFYAKSTTKTTFTDTVTIYTYTDSKGKRYPIFQSRNGNLYCWKVSSKTGKSYKYYIKP